MPPIPAFESTSSHLALVPPDSSPGVSALLDAIAQAHAIDEAERLQHFAVEALERLLPGAAAALFRELDGSGLVALCAAGPRWRTAEREAPAWLAPFTADIAGMVRTSPATGGRLRAHGCCGTSSIEFKQVLIGGGGVPARTLLVIWPGSAPASAWNERVTVELGRHLQMAFRRLDALAEPSVPHALVTAVNAEVLRSAQVGAMARLASSVAHDLNNALITVIGLSDWLLEAGGLDQQQRADVEGIRTAGGRIASLVDRLRFLGRQPQPEAFVEVGLDDLAATSLETVRPQLDACERAGRPVRARLSVDGDSPVLVRVESDAVVALLAHLMGNALDAMPEGGDLVVRVTGRGESATVEVQDTGTGMPPDLARRALEPFVSTKGPPGRGLGLSVCWYLADAQGGTLALDSTPGLGTTVTVAFPLARPLPGALRES